MDSTVIFRQDPPFELLVVPPPTFCEVNVGPNVRNCRDCVPSAGLVCDAHLKRCGRDQLICCSFCLRCLCNNHMYCPCDAAIARRRKVALEIRLGKIMNPPKHTPVLDCLAPARAVGAISSVPASMPQPPVNIVDVPFC